LREALTAANTAPGPWEITFAASLAGQTIALTAPLPVITRNGVMLAGIADATGVPAVTISGALLLPDQRGVLEIHASDITVRSLRFLAFPTDWSVVRIRAGWVIGSAGSPAPQQIANVRVIGNVFEGVATNAIGWGVDVGTDNDAGGNQGAVGATVSSVMIAGNSFTHFKGDGNGILLGIKGSNDTIKGVTVYDNAFADNTYSVEISDSKGSGDTISDVSVIGNTFTGTKAGIPIGTGGGDNTPTSGDVIEHTLISANVFSQTTNAIQIFGGYTGANNSGVTDTEIVNNVLGTGGEIILSGGDGGTGNYVTGVRLVNDTIDNGGGPGLSGGTTTGNTISGVTVSNTIFHGAGAGECAGNIYNFAPDIVTNSLCVGDLYTGTNGNIQGDPRFVNGAAGDYHLQSGSPAINAATSTGAPTTDLDGRARSDGNPDVGAYEFGGTTLPSLTVSPTEAGGATGEVTSSPAGIDCPGLCSAGFQPGTAVTLTVIPWPGGTFSGWSGGCSGTAKCTLTVSAPVTVGATFTPTPSATQIPKPKPTPKCKKGQKSTKKKPCRR
jgi:hypothetical protein